MFYPGFYYFLIVRWIAAIHPFPLIFLTKFWWLEQEHGNSVSFRSRHGDGRAFTKSDSSCGMPVPEVVTSFKTFMTWFYLSTPGVCNPNYSWFLRVLWCQLPSVWHLGGAECSVGLNILVIWVTIIGTHGPPIFIKLKAPWNFLCCIAKLVI